MGDRSSPLLSLYSFSTMLSRGVFRCTAVARLDWAALSQKVTSDAGKAELNALRATYSEIKAVDSAPAAPPAIDWAKWESTIKTPGIVVDFKAAYSKLSVPAMEDTFTAGVEEKFGEAIKSAEVAAAASEARIKELEAELADLNNRRDWSEVTVEEELANNPAIAAEIEDEIANNKW